MDTVFRQLKNEQIEKLRGLKSEYEEIRKITTDYMVPQFSRESSIRSSGIKTSGQASQNGRVASNNYHAGNREAQIL
jgi:hypothetical protein